MAFDFGKNIQSLETWLRSQKKFLINKKKSEIFFFLNACILFLVFACIYLIKYKSNLNEHLFFKKVIAIPRTLEFSKRYNLF